MHTLLNGRRFKHPAVRVLFALLGLLVMAGLIALVLLVALPLAALGLGLVLVGSLAAAFIPRLRRRRDGSVSTASRRRRDGGMKSVEPDAPPRTLR